MSDYHNHQKKIALINDMTGFGRCSIAVALPVISMLRVQCCALPTAIFSNHTGFESFYYQDYTDHMQPSINEWKKLGLEFSGICTGFLGSARQIAIVSDFIRDFKRPDNLVIIDPVMGDYGKPYPTYTEEMCGEMKKLVEFADILTPNVTEACVLTDTPYKEKWKIEEIQEMLDEFQAQFDSIRVKTLLSGEYDGENAIIKLNAGAGGTEACDWCSMLYRMYTRWAERKGFSIEVLDYLDGDEAGIKSVTFQVNGENAYGLLKSEKGVHRLVRISPFNAAGKRQTSFVSCDVMPDIEKDLDVEVNDEDIRIDTYRSSGAGGQHINKTSSAIRITHFPTGIVVQCQNERSQHMNKDKAMQMLKAKLYLLKQQEAEAKLSGIRGEVTDIGWGNQIRSYVMQPYTMVKDHRTNEETGNVDAVMDGAIDIFINAYLKWIALAKRPAEQQ